MIGGQRLSEFPQLDNSRSDRVTFDFYTPDRPATQRKRADLTLDSAVTCTGGQVSAGVDERTSDLGWGSEEGKTIGGDDK